MGARVTDAELAVGHAAEKFDDDGHLADEDVRQGLRDALATLVAEVPAAVAACARPAPGAGSAWLNQRHSPTAAGSSSSARRR